MLAATTFELIGNFHSMNRHELVALAVGFVMSFLTATVVVKLFLRYVSRHDFTVFRLVPHRLRPAGAALLLVNPHGTARQFIDIVLHLDQYLVTFLHDYGLWVYALLFAIIFAETGFVVTPFLPGDSLLFAAGTLAAGSGLDVQWLIAILIAASVGGDNTNYWIGHHLGPRVFRNANSRLLNREYLERTRRFYDDHGGKTVSWRASCQSCAPSRRFVAGVGRMPYCGSSASASPAVSPGSGYSCSPATSSVTCRWCGRT